MTEKEIIAFILRWSIRNINDNEYTFIYTQLPSPEMGEDFVNKYRLIHAEVQEWIENNPDQYKRLLNKY